MDRIVLSPAFAIGILMLSALQYHFHVFSLDVEPNYGASPMDFKSRYCPLQLALNEEEKSHRSFYSILDIDSDADGSDIITGYQAKVAEAGKAIGANHDGDLEDDPAAFDGPSQGDYESRLYRRLSILNSVALFLLNEPGRSMYDRDVLGRTELSDSIDTCAGEEVMKSARKATDMARLREKSREMRKTRMKIDKVLREICRG